MKYIYILIVFGFLLLSMFHYSNNSLSSSSGGAPIGYTGSPFDGRSCTSCHSGPSAVAQPGWISSDIPAEGYIPGETYTISASVSRNGNSQFGFQVAAKSTSGAQAGTLKSISSETNIQVAGRYITHSALGTFASGNNKTWIFEWTAPSTGIGNVTFYAAFLAGDNSGGSSGDVVFTSNLQVKQRTSTNINNTLTVSKSLISSVYPNPVKDGFNLKINLSEPNQTDVRLFDITGMEVGILFSGNLNKGEQILNISLPENIPSGMYTVLLKSGETLTTDKIIVN